ncbi:MAG: hypothetical protein IJZ17_01710, partial [Muribaculaceae bacterium]|nr:hypothetical protein [Muribaculaceae bacterium]
GGVRFFDSSRANVLDNTSIRNTAWGVIVDSVGIETSSPVLTLLNCQLRNSAASVLQVNHASLKAIGCEFAEAADDVVYLNGGRHILNHCTLANYYLFSAIYGSMLHIGDESTVADVANSIIYGNGSTVYPGDLTDYPGVIINTCLLKPAGEDDANFVNILWDSDPKFYTIREDYYFDYRLHDESPAIASADPSLTMPEAMVDRQGLMRGETPDLGAYVYMPETSEE